MAAGSNPLQSSTLESVLALIRARHQENLTVNDLADHAGYSPFHFTRLFAQAMTISPGQYLTAVRMDAAKRLLLSQDLPVIDVATAVGFDSLSSFSRRFRASVGVPPAALRRLADTVADRPPRPFRLVDELQAAVTVTCRVPAELLPDGDLNVWVGWYPNPAPVGLPASGVLAEYGQPLRLPLSPGAPWLLAFAVPRAAEVADQLVPRAPIIARHPVPVLSPQTLTLHFGQPGNTGIPLLSALPSLCRQT